MTMADAVVVLGTLLVAVVAWLAGLTVVLLRRTRTPDEPVFRRLPDGRIRFEWSVATAYGRTRRAVAVAERSAGPPRTGRPRACGAAGPTAAR